MNRFLTYIPQLTFAVIIILVFRVWFVPELVVGGDFWSMFPSMYANRSVLLYAWDWGAASGMGGFVSPLLWVYLNFGIAITTGKILGWDWIVLERVFYLYPFLLLNILVPFFVFRKILFKSNFAILSSALYLLNTYILMIVGGGQVALALAYSLVPLVLYSFIMLFESLKERSLQFSEVLTKIIAASLLFSLQIMYDLRFAYITLIAIGVYWVVKVINERSYRYTYCSIVFILIIPLFTTLALNSYWLLSSFINFENPLIELGPAYSSVAAVKYFSFAGMEKTMSLLHPYWSENIFGKTGFMKWEYLFLPILAYSSLLFIHNNHKKKIFILYFVLLGLIGSFLAKGANDPFGSIYIWLFENFPGFVMFRDPLKWYTLVAVSYAFLIPVSIESIYSWLKSQKVLKLPKINIQIFSGSRVLNTQNFFVVLVILYLLILIRPALFGQLTGLFEQKTIPSDYVRLENYLESKQEFSRTLWVPSLQRFGYFSSSHPAVTADVFFQTTEALKIIDRLSNIESQVMLQESAIKYVIVPYDSEGEIYLTDRQYDEKKYEDVLKAIERVPYLVEKEGFGKLKVYEVSNSKNHFYTKGENFDKQVQYKYINPTQYDVVLTDVKQSDILVFSESFSSQWSLIIDDSMVPSKPYKERLNSFEIPKSGTYSATIYYTPQDWVNRGLVVSGVTFISIIGILIWSYRKKK